MSTQPAGVPKDAEALKEFAALASQARGIEIVTISAPAGIDGVPASIPVGLVRGTSPNVLSLAYLFEAYRTRPEAKTGTAKALTLATFIDLANRYKTPYSAVFADTDWRKPSFQAVIDYHEPNVTSDGEAPVILGGQPDNLRHRIRYEFPLSEEWKAWMAIAGKGLGQGDFASFIEDHIAELVSPFDAERIDLERNFQTTVATPAELMKLSRGLQVNVGTEVKNAITLQSGEGQITWAETHSDAAGKPLKVPGVFLLSVAPFFMGEVIRLPVRLRYRADSGKLIWSIIPYRPDLHVTERVRGDLDKVAAETGLPTFEGSPEA
jgi:hypothetical protein